MIVADYIASLTQRFEQADLCYGHGTDNPADEAFYLVIGSVSPDWQGQPDILERELSEAELNLLDERVDRRVKDHVPTAYLTGLAWFAGLSFYSDQRALIPRSPIAELIENRLEPLLPAEPERILDLCCGGGCIGIAMAFAFDRARVTLVDLSHQALEVASKNVQRHGLQDRMEMVEGNLFSGLTERRYDLIVSNPPYVGQKELERLPKEFHHEPRAGLYSADNGLALPLEILQQAADFLTEQGILILEVGYSHTQLSERLSAVPLLWLDFEYGGEGVLMLTRSQLLKYREHFF